MPTRSAESQHPATQNRLLRALPARDYRQFSADLEPVNLEPGTILYKRGEAPGCVHFPVSAVVSLLATMENGASSEIAVTGNDGVVGIEVFLGGVTATTDAVVQTRGFAFRLTAPVLRREFSRGGELSRVLLRYAQALFTQMAQTAACNRHHPLEKQLCRWLLLRLDLLPSSEVIVTHDAISALLGVRRAGISEAARKLRNAGLIGYTRGCMQVLDRSQLERCACECYSVVKREINRLLPKPA
jgi:CRP-like cAMP-binding protein